MDGATSSSNQREIFREGVAPNMSRIKDLADQNAREFDLNQSSPSDICGMLRMAFDPEGEAISCAQKENIS